VGNIEREIRVDRNFLPTFGHLDVLEHDCGLRVWRIR